MSKVPIEIWDQLRIFNITQTWDASIRYSTQKPNITMADVSWVWVSLTTFRLILASKKLNRIRLLHSLSKRFISEDVLLLYTSSKSIVYNPGSTVNISSQESWFFFAIEQWVNEGSYARSTIVVQWWRGIIAQILTSLQCSHSISLHCKYRMTLTVLSKSDQIAHTEMIQQVISLWLFTVRYLSIILAKRSSKDFKMKYHVVSFLCVPSGRIC